MAVADIETRAIGAFLQADLVEQAKLMTLTGKVELFHLRLIEWAWIQKFYKRFGKAPSFHAVSERFPDLPLQESGDPLAYHAEKLAARERHNTIRRLVTDLRIDLESQDEEASALASEKLRMGILSLERMTGMSRDVEWSESGEARIAEYLKVAEGGGRFAVPWARLNDILAPPGPADLMSLVARTSVGKTWLTVYLARHWWKNGAKVLYISKEMTAHQIGQRLDALEFGVPFGPMVRGSLSQVDFFKYRVRVNQLRTKMAEKGFVISDEEEIEASPLEAIPGQIAYHKPDVVFVDGMDLCIDGDRLVEKGVVAIRKIKRIARAMNVLMVASVQTNRGSEGKKGMTGGGLGNISWSDEVAKQSDYVIEIAGPRGGSWRKLDLIKGRQSGLGSSFVKFEMSPPNFEEQDDNFNPSEGTSTWSGVKVKSIRATDYQAKAKGMR